MSASEEQEKTSNRQEIDPIFKEVLTDLSKQLNFSLKTQFEVSRLPLTIDGLIRLDNQQQMAQLEAQTPFTRLRKHNQIEFKGVEDRLTIPEYHRIVGRTHLYLSDHSLSPTDMNVTIVCARVPKTVLTKAKDHVTFEEIGEGYYYSDANPPTIIIAINELPVIPKNYPFFLFASSKKKFREYLHKTVVDGNLSYIQFAYRLYPDITKEVLAMTTGRYQLSENQIAFIAEDLGDDLLEYFGHERFVDYFGKDQVLDSFTPDEVWAHFGPEQALKWLNSEETMQILTPEESEIFQVLAGKMVVKLEQQTEVYDKDGGSSYGE